jgi:hypothetical protein
MRLICTKAKNSLVVGTGISVGKKKSEELKSKYVHHFSILGFFCGVCDTLFRYASKKCDACIYDLFECQWSQIPTSFVCDRCLSTRTGCYVKGDSSLARKDAWVSEMRRQEVAIKTWPAKKRKLSEMTEDGDN